MDGDGSGWIAGVGWTVGAAVLFTVAVALNEEVIGLMSLFVGGVAAATLFGAWTRQLRSGSGSKSDRRLERRVTELEERLAGTEAEVERIRREHDFDRRLLGSGPRGAAE